MPCRSGRRWPSVLPFFAVAPPSGAPTRTDEATAETERQDGSTALAREGLDVGAVQQLFGLLGGEPIPQADIQFLGPLSLGECPPPTRGSGRPVSTAS